MQFLEDQISTGNKNDELRIPLGNNSLLDEEDENDEMVNEVTPKLQKQHTELITGSNSQQEKHSNKKFHVQQPERNQRQGDTMANEDIDQFTSDNDNPRPQTTGMNMKANISPSKAQLNLGDL